jgi:hypothetical protein
MTILPCIGVNPLTWGKRPSMVRLVADTRASGPGRQAVFDEIRVFAERHRAAALPATARPASVPLGEY